MGVVNFKDTYSPQGFSGGGVSYGGGGLGYSSANNASYGGVVRPVNNVTNPTTSTVMSQTGTGIGSVKQYGTTNVANVDISSYVKNLTNSGGLLPYSGYTDEQKSGMTGLERSVVEKYEAMQKVAEEQNKKKEEVKKDTKDVADSVGYEQGKSLPSVLADNAKALTQAINLLTTTFSEQFTLLNNYMMGGLIYQQQFLDLKTTESGLKIDAMQYQKEAVSSSVLNATNVSGLSPRDIQVSKHSYDIEAKEYAKSPQTVKDWDENTLADIAPREARLVKDATVAKDTTDKINFELDTDDIDIAMPIDISSVYGFESCSSITKEWIDKMGGV